MFCFLLQPLLIFQMLLSRSIFARPIEISFWNWSVRPHVGIFAFIYLLLSFVIAACHCFFFKCMLKLFLLSAICDKTGLEKRSIFRYHSAESAPRTSCRVKKKKQGKGENERVRICSRLWNNIFAYKFSFVSLMPQMRERISLLLLLLWLLFLYGLLYFCFCDLNTQFELKPEDSFASV